MVSVQAPDPFRPGARAGCVPAYPSILARCAEDGRKSGSQIPGYGQGAARNLRRPEAVGSMIGIRLTFASRNPLPEPSSRARAPPKPGDFKLPSRQTARTVRSDGVRCNCADEMFDGWPFAI